MNTYTPIAGPRVPVDKIEQELDALWRATVEEDAPASTKASTINLIVFNRDPQVFQHTLDNIDNVLEHHPGRIVMILSDAEHDTTEVEASVSLFCQSTSSNAQTCCDMIILKTSPQGEAYLPGIITPLLLPDLPVSFWCTDACTIRRSEITSLFGHADRVIINSPRVYESVDELLKTLQGIIRADRDGIITDLTWADITPWREAMAQLFDSDVETTKLQNIRRVHIKYDGPPLFSQALYITGWLAARLGWKFTAAEVLDTIRLNAVSGDQPLVIQLDNEPGKSPALNSITLKVEMPDQQISLSAQRTDTALIQTQAKVNNTYHSPNIIKINNLDAVQKVCAELDFLEKDRIFIETCKTIYRAVKDETNRQ